MSGCPKLARLRHGSFGVMNPKSRELISKLWLARPEDIRYAPATDLALNSFEKEFGPIPDDFRWFLSACGGGVVGSEWVDGIEQLASSHQKHQRESGLNGQKASFFLIGWDGAGQPLGIDRATGEVVVEAEGSDGEVRRLSPSIETFLLMGLIH